MWRKIAWGRYLFREQAARKQRLAKARKAAIKEAEGQERQERAAVRKVSPHWVMLGTEKGKARTGSSPTSQSTQQLVPSSDQPERGSSRQKRPNLESNPSHLTTFTSSHPTSSGRKRKQAHEETGEPDELDSLEKAHSPKRIRAMSSSSFNSVDSKQAAKRRSATESRKKPVETEESISEARRSSTLIGIDTTKSVYFKMIAMGMDPNTPIVPLTRKDIAEAQRTAALAATPEPDDNINGNTHLTGQFSTSNLSIDHQSSHHALQSTGENAMKTVNHQRAIENSMGPPQTPIKYPLSTNGLSRASYSPEEQALFEQVTKIKAELDAGSEWYREELEKARCSTSSRSSPRPDQSTNIVRQSRLHHYTPSKLRKGITSSAQFTHTTTTNGVQTDPPTSDPKSPSYWRSRISKIYKPDDKADEAKRQKYGVLPKETAAQKRLREFDRNSPSRTQIRQAKSGGKDAWFEKSAYGQQKAAQAKGKGKGKAHDWGDMDYVDADMSDEEDILGEDAQMTDASEEAGEEWDGLEDGNGVGYAIVGQNGFAGASLGSGGGTGASADDAIEL